MGLVYRDGRPRYFKGELLSNRGVVIAATLSVGAFVGIAALIANSASSASVAQSMGNWLGAGSAITLPLLTGMMAPITLFKGNARLEPGQGGVAGVLVGPNRSGMPRRDFFLQLMGGWSSGSSGADEFNTDLQGVLGTTVLGYKFIRSSMSGAVLFRGGGDPAIAQNVSATDLRRVLSVGIGLQWGEGLFSPWVERRTHYVAKGETDAIGFNGRRDGWTIGNTFNFASFNYWESLSPNPRRSRRKHMFFTSLVFDVSYTQIDDLGSRVDVQVGLNLF